jgi:ABC-type antimicrobial peptide transport system permease subunit
MALAIPLVVYLQVHGFSWGALSEVMTGSSIYYFRFSPVHAVINFGSGILIALAGSLYAAWVNTRMDVVETLRFN